MRCRDDFEWPWYPLEGEDFSSSYHFRINSTQPYDFVCPVLASLSYVNNVVAWGDDADGDEEDDGGDCHCAVLGVEVSWLWGFGAHQVVQRTPHSQCLQLRKLIQTISP